MKKIFLYTRLLLAGVASIIMGFIGIAISIFRPFHRSNAYHASKFFNGMVVPILGFKMIYINREKFNQTQGPAIIISNHQSNLDVFFVSNSMPKGCVTMGKKIIAWLPIWGQMYWLTGNILIDRSKSSRALGIMNKVAKIMSEENKSIWIMPEGTRSLDGKILPFKKGAFYTAISGGFPIITVAISSVSEGIDLSKLNAGAVKIKVLESYETKHLTKDDIPELVDKCRTSIIKGVNDLNKVQPI